MKQVKTWILGVALAVMLTATASANNYEKGKEAYEAGDYATALSILKPLAEAGNADAQLTLSWMYYFGRGVPQDDAEWTKWRDRAFNVVDATAQDTPTETGTLGTIKVSEDDFHEGVRAYANGDYATAYAKIFPLAELQNADALYFLGLMYYNGHGVEQDYEEAAHTLRQSAKGGNTDAQNLLGVMYDHGKGVPQNVEEAEQWFRRAAAAGYAEAQQNLERLLASIEAAAEAVTPADDLQKGLAAYEAGDYETALAILTPLAWAGNADAQNTLGWMYDYGHGVEENDAEAVKWYRRAAKQGNAIAQNNLGKMYEHGIGVSQNDEEAIKWYRSAAEQGHAEARQNLNGMLASTASAADDTASAGDVQEGIDAYDAGDYDTAFAILKPLAEAGDAEAQFNLGLIYAGHTDAQNNLGWENFGRGWDFSRDVEEMEEDDAEAVKWYRRAAEAGHIEAQYWLGYMYANGEGVEEDDAEAVKWYRLAAEGGHPEAQDVLVQKGEDAYDADDYATALTEWTPLAEAGNAQAQTALGEMYLYGKGVPQNFAEAAKWYRLAAESGHTEAQNTLGKIAEIASIQIAAEAGDAEAQYTLGKEYDDYTYLHNVCFLGFGEVSCRPDPYRFDLDFAEEAVKWYRRAAEQGHTLAQNTLAEMYRYGTGGVEQDGSEAVKWYRLAAGAGDADAPYNLGLMYSWGQGVAENDAEAEKWFRLAAEQGHTGAQDRLRRIQEQEQEGAGVRQEWDSTTPCPVGLNCNY